MAEDAVGELALADLLREIRGCTHCAADLPLGPNPVLRAGVGAGLLIVGQAPGTRVHASGIPWNDPSGDRLRDWLQLEREAFYDESRIAIVPMGFCYPGSGSSGDKPPRPECAPLWHEPLLAHLPPDRLDIIIGAYAQKRYLADPAATVTANVAGWAGNLPDRVVLPHPSPRNRHWLTRNPWFEAETLPAVKHRVRQLLTGYPSSR